jgi:hypothetical protein
MTRYSRPIAALAFIAAGVFPAVSASAQPAPLYPYAMQQDQPYAVQVAPNTYVIQRPAQTRDYPYVHCVNCGRGNNVRTVAPAAKRFDSPHKPVDRALVEELRARSKHNVKVKEKAEAKEEAKEKSKKEVKEKSQEKSQEKSKDKTKQKETDINTTKVVRDAPVVVEHKRYVDDPPRVIERKIIVDEPARAKCKRGLIQNCDDGSRASGDEGNKRVIDADAQVTILGPDRMSIRLFRKGHGPSAKASDDE